MKRPIERNSVHTVIGEFVKRQVQIFQTWLHVAKHVAWDQFNLVPHEHKVQQGLGQVGGDAVELVVGEIDRF